MPVATAALATGVTASAVSTKAVSTTDKIIEGLNEDATALGTTERDWVHREEEIVKKDVQKVEHKLEEEMHELDAEAEHLEQEFEKKVAPVEQEVAKVESEVISVGKEVESEIGEVIEVGAKELEKAGAVGKVMGAEAEEGVIIVVGTMEEMVFSWTFFGVFLFSLWRISKHERRERAKRNLRDPEAGMGDGYPSDRLFTPEKEKRRGGSQLDSIFSGVDPSLSEGDREALELGRLLLQETAAAERHRAKAREASQNCFESYRTGSI
jgi:Skp family chaperone for outer membrane proteins